MDRKTAEHIRELVAAAPPLSDELRAELARVLGSAPPSPAPRHGRPGTPDGPAECEAP